MIVDGKEIAFNSYCSDLCQESNLYLFKGQILLIEKCFPLDFFQMVGQLIQYAVYFSVSANIRLNTLVFPTQWRYFQFGTITEFLAFKEVSHHNRRFISLCCFP